MAKLVLVPKVDAPKARSMSRRADAISKAKFLQCACGSRSLIQVTTGLALAFISAKSAARRRASGKVCGMVGWAG